MGYLTGRLPGSGLVQFAGLGPGTTPGIEVSGSKLIVRNGDPSESRIDRATLAEFRSSLKLPEASPKPAGRVGRPGSRQHPTRRVLAGGRLGLAGHPCRRNLRREPDLRLIGRTQRSQRPCRSQHRSLRGRPVAPAGPSRPSRPTRRAMRRYRLAMALVGAMLVGLAVASVVAVLDVSWVLPDLGPRHRPGRAGRLDHRRSSRRPLLAPGRRFGKGEAAAEVESSFPELGQRLRTTLEYSEPTPTTAPASPALVRALVGRHRPADRRARLPGRRPLGRPGVVEGSALALAVVVVVVVLGYDPTLRIAARRLLLLPVHYTTLAVEPGDKTLKEGAGIHPPGHPAGRPVASARWLQRPVGSRDAWTVDLARPPRRMDVGPLIGTARSRPQGLPGRLRVSGRRRRGRERRLPGDGHPPART